MREINQFTEAGTKFNASLTAWLQDTRLMSEAVFQLEESYKKTGTVSFAEKSWPKSKKGDFELPKFEIKPIPLAHRMDVLLQTLWRSQFVFLEAMWEEYLQDLVLELRHKDASIFEPFCEQQFMAGIVREVLSGQLNSVEEIKDEAAARFAAGITRKPWKEQWQQLVRLEVGLPKDGDGLLWFPQLDTYFEMRNCLIHRQGRVSSLLNQKTDYYTKSAKEVIDIWPQHLDFYRSQFINCLKFIEGKIAQKYASTKGAKRSD
jgi:hypothetical protein